MRRAPLLVPAIAALLAIVAEQHGFVDEEIFLVVLACTVAYVCRHRQSTRVHVVAVAIAFAAGAAISALRGHPPVLASERATIRYEAIVTGDVREGDTGESSTVLASPESTSRTSPVTVAA